MNEVFSRRQSFITYSLNELLALFKNGQIKVRDANKLQIRALKKYIFENALNEQIYFPPIVANVAKDGLNNGKPTEFFIVDGNQRIRAFSQIQEMAYRAIISEQEHEVKKGYKLLHFLGTTEIAVQLFEGLSNKEADQLYIDLNTKGEKVALSKKIALDSRNELSKITNHILNNNKQLKVAGVEMEKRAVVRPANKKLLSLQQLRQIAAIFLTGKAIQRTTYEGYETHLATKEYIKLLDYWFDGLFALYPPERIGDLNKSMLASFPLLISIAYYANKGFERGPFSERKRELQARMNALKGVDWTAANPIWQGFKGTSRAGHYFLTYDKETIEKLAMWLKGQGVRRM